MGRSERGNIGVTLLTAKTKEANSRQRGYSRRAPPSFRRRPVRLPSVSRETCPGIPVAGAGARVKARARMEGEGRPVRGRADGRKEPDCALQSTVLAWGREADPSRQAGRVKVTPGGWKSPGNSGWDSRGGEVGQPWGRPEGKGLPVQAPVSPSPGPGRRALDLHVAGSRIRLFHVKQLRRPLPGASPKGRLRGPDGPNRPGY